VFTFHCFGIFFTERYFRFPAGTFLIAVLSGALIAAAVLFSDRIYTSTTFLSLGLLLSWLLYRKTPWLNLFFFTWLILLIPFFIVNGILTGTGLQDPVVWYNNSENLGIRLFTIPVEDVFYGMLLILVNVTVYRKLISIKKKLL
jgi:lycopene cyclase domain-containing protein